MEKIIGAICVLNYSKKFSNFMKLSIQLSTSLVAALATLSQSAIATPRYASHQHSIDSSWVFNNRYSLPKRIALDPPSELANKTEVRKTATTIKSVLEVKDSLIELRSPCEHGCSGYGLHIRAARMCTLLQALDTRIGGKIVKKSLPSSSEKLINISRSDLNLMKMIYKQCKWYKWNSSDYLELTYHRSSTTVEEKIDRLLSKNK
jgi:hypothetical protein